MRSVLITGASRGIGAACALQFAREGYRVILNYCKSEEKARALAERIQKEGGQAALAQADVSQRAQVEKMVRESGPIDVLVNNAGIAQQKLFTLITPQEWERMFAVNVTGMFHTCQCVLPQMIDKKAGRIVNLSSMWGQTGASCEVHYSAAKAAIIGFTKALAKEVGPSGITVNCVAPGVIDTDMNGSLSESDLRSLAEETPLGRIGGAQEVAACVAFLASEEAAFLTGQVLSPNGGMVI